MAEQRTIAVIGSTGRQGGGVVRDLKERGQFRVRALTRHPDDYDGPADEVVFADLSRPETLGLAFDGAYGVFAVTNFWEPGTDEVAQGTAAAAAAKDAQVEHFIWSTLPNVEQISGGKFHVAHFTDKARVNGAVEQAGFPLHTFVEAPFYFQNLTSQMAPQDLPDGSKGWTLPIDPSAKRIHMGDIDDLGSVVAGAFEQPERVGDGTHLALAAGLMSFDDVVSEFHRRGHQVAFHQVDPETFNGFFPGAEELSAMLGYFTEHTYLGPDADAKTAAAATVATRPATGFSRWAEANIPRAD